MSLLAVLAMGAIVLTIPPRCFASETGGVKGRFIASPAVATNDEGGKRVDGRPRGLSGVLVYLCSEANDAVSKKDIKQSKSISVTLGRSGFDPSFVAMVRNQRLEVRTTSSIVHSLTFADSSPYVHTPKDGKYVFTFKTASPVPRPLCCGRHVSECLKIFVHNNRFFAITDREGRFHIDSLPVGQVQLRVWHERTGYLNARQSWRKGVVKLNLQSGKVEDLGTLDVSPVFLRAKKKKKGQR